MARLRPLLLVALGGIVGSLARWGAVAAGPDDRERLVLFGLNVGGSLLLGAFLAGRERLGEEALLAVGTGFTGGLTTFATFAVDVAGQLEAGEALPAVANALGTTGAALVAAGLGFRLTRLAGLHLLTRTRRRRGARR